MTWNLTAPQASSLKDRDITEISSILKGKNIALMLCGSIAAYKGPDLARELRRHGASVQPFLSGSAQSFVAPMALEWTSGKPTICSLSADAEHLGGDEEFDIYLVAPASYNTINKFAFGVADTAITVTLASALGLLEQKKSKIFMLPCMHGSMHNQVLIDSMKSLIERGVHFLTPRQEDGKNKLPEPLDLINEMTACLSQQTL